MEVLNEMLTIEKLREIAGQTFGDMVKAVVDVELEKLAIDAELHSDLEAALLANGSDQKNIWGINLYPDMQGDDFIEFDSLINVRPSQNNKSRRVDSPGLQSKIRFVVDKWVKR